MAVSDSPTPRSSPDTRCINLKHYAGLTGLGAPVAPAPPAEGTSARARRAAGRGARRDTPAGDGPCWGAWETT